MSLYAELKRRNVIRVVVAYLAGAWLLIQVADTVFPAYGFPDAALTTLISILVIGLIPAIVISWVFELTPDGLQRDSGAISGAAVRPRETKWLDRSIMIVLALGIGYFAFDKFVLDPARDAAQQREAEDRGRAAALVESYGDKSIAVLPFADLSEGADQAYFSDGIAEEILNLLAQVKELRVISRSSAFQYRGDEVHIPTVADELNVAYVLEGSVRKAGDRIRITAQLIDARADAHLWSDNFERDFSDIFTIQDEIAGSIVDELQIELLGEGPRVQRTDPETYALYLQAHHALFVLQDYSESTEELLKQVIARDPDYLPALTALVHITLLLTGDTPDSKYSLDEGIALMRGYVDRALAIDPEDARANAHRGWMAFFYQNDLETAALYLNRALQYGPHDETTLFYAGTFSGYYLGRNEDAITLLEAALSRNPLCNSCLWSITQAYIRVGRLEDAFAANERRMRMGRGGWISRGDILLFQGDVEAALESYDHQKDARYGWLSARAIALFELGEMDAFHQTLDELEAIEEVDAFFSAARVHAWVGNSDAAFEYLDKYLDPDSPQFTRIAAQVIWNPFFENLHGDPRWTALRAQAGLSEARLASIEIELPEF